MIEITILGIGLAKQQFKGSGLPSPPNSKGGIAGLLKDQ